MEFREATLEVVEGRDLMSENKEYVPIYADLIVDFLAKKKLSHVFDLSGGMIAYIEDAISRHPDIDCIPFHHEQAAGFAAEGYARKSGNFAVAIATSGPGATNLVTAIGSCFFDSVPAMFITGQVHTSNLKKSPSVRQEGFQETDIVSVVQTLTKYAVLVKDVNEIENELEKAFSIMKSGRPGPVLIDIPINLQRTPVETVTRKTTGAASREDQQFEKEIDPVQLTKFEELLATSNAPLVLAGHGIRLADAKKELVSFVKKNNLPVVTSLLGLDTYDYQDGLVGYIGTNGNRDANIVLANADLIIVLGSRLDLRQTGDPSFFNSTAKIVHVDIDEHAIGYSINVDLAFQTDVKNFLQMAGYISTPAKGKWKDFIIAVQQAYGRFESFDEKVNPNTFIKDLSLLSPTASTVVVDVGQNQQWCAQSWRVKEDQRLLFSGGMGAMGFALPAAIGAWFADMKSDVIVISGDGGIQINLQELETVHRNGIPLKLFIMNNKSLGMVREFQDIYLNKNYQSTVKGYGHPDFKQLSAAYGMEYTLISKGYTQADLTRILEIEGPVLVEVDVDMFAPLYPKVVYGHAMDDQAPYLDEKQKAFLDDLKEKLSA